MRHYEASRQTVVSDRRRMLAACKNQAVPHLSRNAFAARIGAPRRATRTCATARAALVASPIATEGQPKILRRSCNEQNQSGPAVSPRRTMPVAQRSCTVWSHGRGRLDAWPYSRKPDAELTDEPVDARKQGLGPSAEGSLVPNHGPDRPGEARIRLRSLLFGPRGAS